MLKLQDALEIHQTLQNASAMKSAMAGISKSIVASADDSFMDNAARIEELFGTLAAEDYLRNRGVYSPRNNKKKKNP